MPVDGKVRHSAGDTEPAVVCRFRRQVAAVVQNKGHLLSVREDIPGPSDMFAKAAFEGRRDFPRFSVYE